MRGSALLAATCLLYPSEAKLADRSRLVKARGGPYRDNGRPIEGPKYRNTRWSDAQEADDIRKVHNFETTKSSFRSLPGI